MILGGGTISELINNSRISAVYINKMMIYIGTQNGIILILSVDKNFTITHIQTILLFYIEISMIAVESNQIFFSTNEKLYNLKNIEEIKYENVNIIKISNFSIEDSSASVMFPEAQKIIGIYMLESKKMILGVYKVKYNREWPICHMGC